MAFTNLAHHIDIEWMLTAHGHTRKDGAVGVDGQTADEYEVNLEANLQNLLDRAKSGTYVAPPVRRVHIPKAGSATETRPLGIPICRSYCTSLQLRLGLIEGGPAQKWALSLQLDALPRPSAADRLTQGRDDLLCELDPPGSVRSRLDPIHTAQLAPMRDCRDIHIEYFRRGLRGTSSVRPVTPGARRRSLGTTTHNGIGVSELFYDVLCESTSST